MMKRLILRPRIGRTADGGWIAHYPGWELQAEGATEEAAVQRLLHMKDEMKRRDPETYARRLEEFFANPPPGWEVVEDDGRAYGERLEELGHEMDQNG